MFNRYLVSSLAVALSLTAAACTDEESTTSTDPVVEAHIDIMRERIEANNTKNWTSWQALHTPDAVRTAPELTEPLVGAAAMRASIEELVVTFPDYTLELVEAFGTGNRLMARMHTKGTMLGPIDIGGTSVPPTGLAFEQDWVAVLTFEGDKISAIDEFHDNYGILVQLGLSQ
jgi:ketosteroid isomerase-like protein